MEKKRFHHIDLLELIAIFFVVLYHGTLYTYDFLSEGSLVHYLRYFFRTILSTCVPLFFFANGFLLFGKDFTLSKHIRKTVKLILLTIIWGFITLLCLQVIKQEPLSLTELINGLWIWKQGWINHLWYMGALVCIYVFFPLLKSVYDANRKLFYYFTAICALFTFGSTAINHAGTACMHLLFGKPAACIDINFFNIFNPFRSIRGYAFVYFCVGGIAYHFQGRIGQISAKKRNLLSVFGILLSCLGLFSTGLMYSNSTRFLCSTADGFAHYSAARSVWGVVWNGYDSIFTFFNVLFLYLLCLNWKKDARCVRAVSSNTLGIYFLHTMLLSLISPYLMQYGFLRNLPFNVVYAIFVLLVSYAICFVLKKIPIVSRLVK